MNTNCNVHLKINVYYIVGVDFFNHEKEHEAEGDQSDVITMALKDWE